MHGWVGGRPLADIDHQFSMAPSKLPEFKANYSHFSAFAFSSSFHFHSVEGYSAEAPPTIRRRPTGSREGELNGQILEDPAPRIHLICD